VLKGAHKVFLRDGFERAAVDDIARQAGVSKATIYADFPTGSGCFWKRQGPDACARPRQPRRRSTPPCRSGRQ